MGERTKRFWWLKLREDFFDQAVIKKLRRMAGGDTYTIIYLKMQLLSLRNDGALLFENVEDTFEEELSLKLDEATDDVQVTLLFLQKHNLIEIINDDEYVLSEAVRNMDSECDSAARVRNFRERKAAKTLQCNGKELHCALQSVTCNTEKEIEKEIEIDRRDKKKYMSSSDDAPAPLDYKSIAETFNSTCQSLPKVRDITDQRKKAIRGASKRIEGEGGFEALFRKVESSDFLTGRNGGWTGCGFDWILKPANLTKILEGNYDNWAGSVQPDYTDPSRYANTGWEE